MEESAIAHVVRVTRLILITACLFWLFFQTGKSGPFRNLNPFAEDPYDAVGSLTVQGALLIGLLSFARSLRLRRDRGQWRKTRLVLRGNALVLAGIIVTLSVDSVAVLVNRAPLSLWRGVLMVDFGILAILTAACVVALAVVVRKTPTEQPPANLTPADAIDDLFEMARVVAVWLAHLWPGRITDWSDRLSSDRLFARVSSINPRWHPWRFATALGLLAGMLLVLVQLSEGLPPSLAAGLLVAMIFIGVETAATLAGFAVFGGFLGLRPSWGR